jgi:hypothetical protein
VQFINVLFIASVFIVNTLLTQGIQITRLEQVLSVPLHVVKGDFVQGWLDETEKRDTVSQQMWHTKDPPGQKPWVPRTDLHLTLHRQWWGFNIS